MQTNLPRRFHFQASETWVKVEHPIQQAHPTLETTMNTQLSWAVVVTIAIPLGGVGADKLRVFITESQALQLTGDAAVGDTKGSLLVTGGTSPDSVEVMKNFGRWCPDVIVTANREKADYIVRLDHEGANPATPFVRGNKVAVFNKAQDLIYSNSTRFLSNAVKDACRAITK